MTPTELYNPNEIFSQQYYYVNDALPAEYHEQWKGWTVDGALAHNNDAWKKICELNLDFKIARPVLHRLLKEALESKALDTALTDCIQSYREELRDEGNYKVADRLRDILELFGTKVKDKPSAKGANDA